MNGNLIFAEVVLKSKEGISLFNAKEPITSKTVTQYYSDKSLIEETVEKLKSEGFNVLHSNLISISVAAPKNIYERAFKTEIVQKQRKTVAGGNTIEYTIFDTIDTLTEGLINTSKSGYSATIDGIALEVPRVFGNPTIFTPERIDTDVNNESPTKAFLFPPPREYWHLNVPADISLGLNADRVHRKGITGRDVKVIMVDSGWYRHPYFMERGYNARPVVLGAGTSNPEHDEVGHGTGESANLFSIAPDIDFTLVKGDVEALTNSFKIAVDLKPDIISCSWYTTDYSETDTELNAIDKVLGAHIAYAVRKGITVVFAAGNGEYAFPGQHPEVISVGGAYMYSDGTFEASPFASSFVSKIYEGRSVPDLCGLVGMPPRGMYIMLPVEPGCMYDISFSTEKGDNLLDYPQTDETEGQDGWAAFSGTSAAAPQIAGICALIKQVAPELNPFQIRDILKETARDVIKGTSNIKTGGNMATKNVDIATGSGLVDAFSAVAKVLTNL